MNVESPTLEELVRELPTELRAEVRDFVEFLLTKRGQRSYGILRQNWAGALRDSAQQYTSVELQHKASEWRDS
jgi:ABC-type Fe3+ transport system substrate-binding protein